eukprot:1159264-Pelagomonas_calceolata.AAC.5
MLCVPEEVGGPALSKQGVGLGLLKQGMAVLYHDHSKRGLKQKEWFEARVGYRYVFCSETCFWAPAHVCKEQPNVHACAFACVVCLISTKACSWVPVHACEERLCLHEHVH